MSLKMHILVFFSNQISVIKGSNSCLETMFYGIALLNVKISQRKTVIRFFLLLPDL